MKYEDLTELIIGCAMKVHSTLGNGFNQRIRKTEGGIKTFYIRDNMNVLAEYDGSGNLTANYVYGIDGIVAKVIPSVGTKYFYKDHLGSTRQVNTEQGNTAQQIRYYPYGGISQMSGSETDYLFTGKENDGHAEGDLTYFGARYYDPIIGRWLIPDPLAGKYPSLSSYVYAANNPMKFIDPNGKAVFGLQIRRGDNSSLYLLELNWNKISLSSYKFTENAPLYSPETGQKYGPGAKLPPDVYFLEPREVNGRVIPQDYPVYTTTGENTGDVRVDGEIRGEGTGTGAIGPHLGTISEGCPLLDPSPEKRQESQKKRENLKEIINRNEDRGKTRLLLIEIQQKNDDENDDDEDEQK